MGRTAAELGAIVRHRRLALGLTQVEVIEASRGAAGGATISEPTYRAVETGRTDASDLTLAAISRGLSWPADTLRRIRDGEDPPPASPTGAQPLDDDLEMAALIGKLDPDQRDMLKGVLRSILGGEQ